jgi:hypothetical protein
MSRAYTQSGSSEFKWGSIWPLRGLIQKGEGIDMGAAGSPWPAWPILKCRRSTSRPVLASSGLFAG